MLCSLSTSVQDWQGLPTERTDNGATALHFAARNGHPDVVTILLACPIVVRMRIYTGRERERKHVLNMSEYLILYIILLVTVCTVLLYINIFFLQDAAAEDKDGKTPLALCEKLQQGKWTEVVKILKNPNTQNAVNRFARIETFNPEDAVDFRIFLMDGKTNVENSVSRFDVFAENASIFVGEYIYFRYLVRMHLCFKAGLSIADIQNKWVVRQYFSVGL